MGKNGVGKTTLMTNIGTGNIDGLPSELRTVYVQHDDPTAVYEGVSILEEILRYPDVISVGVSMEAARVALTGIGFTDVMIASSRSMLSGGWKMKLLIVRAMLCKADILLLDEVITDVIHYEQKQLVYYRGSLKDFVAIHPEAQYYYELSGSSLTFTLPVPERLDGVASNSRAVLKMDSVTFTYPGAPTPALTDCSVKLTLGSRVAVTGVNGAGKSTLIRLLVQEYQPDVGPNGNPLGEVWKHHNLRVAYVAQHSFHHIEQHLEESPVDYIKWRFADGVDKEDMAKSNAKISTEEEVAALAQRRMGDVIDVVGRRMNGRKLEYECTFVGKSTIDIADTLLSIRSCNLMNTTVNECACELMGLQKQVTQCDNRIAAAVAGLAVRPLVAKEIQSHLDDFNLDAEFGTFGKIKRLSGGQKVKLVFAAAMWNKPHILVLDEPTNYLDREALAALTEAIKTFQGGVVIISHNSAFTEALCTETWHVSGGRCAVLGENGVAEEDSRSEAKSSKKSTSSAARKFKSSATDVTISDVAAAQTTEESRAGSLKADKVGNVNSTKTVMKEQLKNPRTLEYLTKVEIRKLTKCALAAGVPLKEYVSKITKDSPEWKWLGKPIR
ncbi:elf1 [Symbiodinium microadriaticum]|nr:elf1 [Symbiodinium microadriaticum]